MVRLGSGRTTRLDPGLRQISKRALVWAWQALFEGKLDEALKHAKRSFCVDAGGLEALLVEAAVYRQRVETVVGTTWLG